MLTRNIGTGPATITRTLRVPGDAVRRGASERLVTP